MKAQEYLDKHYPKEERQNVRVLNISLKTTKLSLFEKLDGCLDLSDFTNLTEFFCCSNTITGLDLSNNLNLETVVVFDNTISANLNVFSHLTKLKRLDLGLLDLPSFYEKNNEFHGSLKALENCKQLENLCIGFQNKITEGLEYLPFDKLTHFGCQGTVFQNILRPYNYDVKV
jgi:hypothetical protein